AHNVWTRVEVAVENDAATGTGIGTVSEGERLPMSTRRAVLTRLRRIHRHTRATGPCRLVRKEASELAPRRVLAALGQTVVVRHPVDREVFHGDQVNGVDDATAVLMGDVAPSPGDAFRRARARAPVFGARRCPRLRLAVRALDLRQRLVLTAQA